MKKVLISSLAIFSAASCFGMQQSQMYYQVYLNQLPQIDQFQESPLPYTMVNTTGNKKAPWKSCIANTNTQQNKPKNNEINLMKLDELRNNIDYCIFCVVPK